MGIIRFFNHLASYALRNYGSRIPDDKYLKILFRVETGNRLNLETPLTFQEKIQWLKLNDRNPEYTKMVDKVAVKKCVANVIGDEFIIPTIGVWDSIEEIDISKLPDKFVLKTSNGGGSCGVIVVKDKSKFSIDKASALMKSAKGSDVYKGFREWPYKDVNRKILAEQFICDGNDDLIDYKFYCFNGVPYYCQVIRDRHSRETIDFYDMDWTLQPFVGLNPQANNSKTPLQKPENFDRMIEICQKLAIGIPFVRIDQYNINGRIYFGEITFYPGSGFGRFEPEQWNLKLGNLLKIK